MAEIRTLEELRKGLKHLQYEFNMLILLSRILAFDSNGTGVIRNALVESFLVHARLLIGFFYGETPFSDDIIPKHFLTGKKWEDIRPHKSKMLDKVERNAHKHLAHLSYARIERKVQWPYMEIAKEIEGLLNIFLENIDNKLKKEN